MKKNTKLTVKNDDIDLFVIINDIWEGKFKIIIITAIFFIFGSIYHYRLAEIHQFSLEIRKSKDSEFIKFLPINKFFNEYELNEIIEMKTNRGDKKDSINKINQMNQINKETIFNRFVEEFLDYEELVQVLQKDPKIVKEIVNLSDRDKNFKLYNYAKRFKIVKSKKKIKKNLALYLLYGRIKKMDH